MIPSPWYMHPESFQSLYDPWYMRSLKSSSTKVVPVEEPIDWVSSLAIHGRQMRNNESVLTQRISVQLLDIITTKPLPWKRSPMNWLEASASPNLVEPHPTCEYSSTMSHHCSQPSTHHGEGSDLSASPRA